MPIWLSYVSVGLLIVYFFVGRNAVWGGGTIGLILGIVAALIKSDLDLIWTGVVIGVISGFIAELLSMLGAVLRNSRS